MWFLLTAYNKMQEEGAELKKELLSKKEAALEYLEIFQSTHFTKKKKSKLFLKKTQGISTIENKTSRDWNQKIIHHLSKNQE